MIVDKIVYLNGALVPWGEARLSPLDRGFLYGYGLFETMRCYGGRVFRLDRHLARLMHSAERLALAAALDPPELEQAILKTIEANKLSDARIRLTVSAGEGERGLAPPTSGKVTIFVVAEELVLPARIYQEGVGTVIVSLRRNSQSPLSQTKSLNYLDSLIAYSEALAQGADEAIMLNERGFVAEGSTSNIFLGMAGKLLTPSPESGILPGITREAVLELAHAVGIEVVEGEIPPSDLLQADEVFLTSSVREIVPVVRVDGNVIGSGRPGEMTIKLMAAYKELVRKELSEAC
ncbi:MAG: branched-chain-amino-acid transaminase [Chloroflexi bacterium]|nr:MAG: branched-chain-amino-acid transaminase [Chloroflexota bacterium]